MPGSEGCEVKDSMSDQPKVDLKHRKNEFFCSSVQCHVCYPWCTATAQLALNAQILDRTIAGASVRGKS